MIGRAVVLLALLLIAGLAQAQIGTNTTMRTVEGSILGVPEDGPGQFRPVIFLRSDDPASPSGVWMVGDVSSITPPDAKAVRLDGLLVITHGATQEICDLTVAFRRLGSDYDPAYVMQTIDVFTGSGQRSTAGTWIALDASRRFEYRWTHSTTGQWPAACAYLVNLRMTAYLR